MFFKRKLFYCYYIIKLNKDGTNIDCWKLDELKSAVVLFKEKANPISHENVKEEPDKSPNANSNINEYEMENFKSLESRYEKLIKCKEAKVNLLSSQKNL